MSRTIEIKVVPRAKHNEVVEKGDRLVVRVTAPADQGKANVAVMKLLGKYMNIVPSRLRILRGNTARYKVIEII